MKYFLGIDPGKSGGFVILNENYEIIEKHVTPLIGKEYNKTEILNLFTKYPYTFIAIEKPGSIFGIGKSAMASLSHCVGLYEGIAAMSKIPHVMVKPQEWQKSQLKNVPKQFKISKGKKKHDTKATASLAAVNFYPGADFRKSTRAKNFHDGIIDAIFICKYAVDVWKKGLLT